MNSDSPNTADIVERLLEEHIQRCRDSVTKCLDWSPAQAEWSRARDALLDYRDDLRAHRKAQAHD